MDCTYMFNHNPNGPSLSSIIYALLVLFISSSLMSTPVPSSFALSHIIKVDSRKGVRLDRCWGFRSDVEQILTNMSSKFGLKSWTISSSADSYRYLIHFCVQLPPSLLESSWLSVFIDTLATAIYRLDQVHWFFKDVERVIRENTSFEFSDKKEELEKSKKEETPFGFERFIILTGGNPVVLHPDINIILVKLRDHFNIATWKLKTQGDPGLTVFFHGKVECERVSRFTDAFASAVFKLDPIGWLYNDVDRIIRESVSCQFIDDEEMKTKKKEPKDEIQIHCDNVSPVIDKWELTHMKSLVVFAMSMLFVVALFCIFNVLATTENSQRQSATITNLKNDLSKYEALKTRIETIERYMVKVADVIHRQSEFNVEVTFEIFRLSGIDLDDNADHTLSVSDKGAAEFLGSHDSNKEANKEEEEQKSPTGSLVHKVNIVTFTENAHGTIQIDTSPAQPITQPVLDFKRIEQAKRYFCEKSAPPPGSIRAPSTDLGNGIEMVATIYVIQGRSAFYNPREGNDGWCQCGGPNHQRACTTTGNSEAGEEVCVCDGKPPTIDEIQSYADSYYL